MSREAEKERLEGETASRVEEAADTRSSATPPSLRLNAFLQELRCDLDSGRRPSLRDYLQRYEDIEEEVAREVLAVRMSIAETQSSHRLGNYQLLERIGRGGQGIVYRARDSRLEREVALKVLPVLEHADRERWDRFRREASVASKLQHPGLCPVLDAAFEDGQPYIAMPWIPGETLAVHIARAQMENDGHPSASSRARLLGMVERVACALHVAHESGVVHRDVKPSNVMVQPSDEPVLLDFGLAKAIHGEGTLSATGDLLGTPAYMSPECINGGEVDRRCDVYSLGVIIYECVTGRKPFASPDRERLIQAILREEPEPPSRVVRGLSKDLEAVILVALAKLPQHRYPSAKELANDLEALRVGRPVVARPIGRLKRAMRWTRRNPLGAGLTLVGTAALTLAGYVGQGLWSAHLESNDRGYRLRLYRAAFLPDPGRETDLSALIEDRPLEFMPWAILVSDAMLVDGALPTRVLDRRTLPKAREYLERSPEEFRTEPVGQLLRLLLSQDPSTFQSWELPSLLAKVPPPRDSGEKLRLAYVAGFVTKDVRVVRDIIGYQMEDAEYLSHRMVSHIAQVHPAPESLRAATMAYALEPDDPGAVMTLATTMHLLPREFRGDKSVEDETIVRLVRRALDLAPDSASVLANAANALEGRVPGWEGECEAMYRRAIDLNPESVVARRNLTNLLRKVGRLTPELRLALTEPIVDTYGEFAWSWIDLGIAHRELGHPERGIQVLEEGLNRVVPSERVEILGRMSEWLAPVDLPGALFAYDACFGEASNTAKDLDALWFVLDVVRDDERRARLRERTIRAKDSGVALGEKASLELGKGTGSN